MTTIYAPDMIISEASGLISTALENIELPGQDGFTYGMTGTKPTKEMTIFAQIFDPQASKVDAPALFMQVIHGASGRLLGIGQDDICTLQIIVNTYCHTATDSVWLSRVCHLIQRGLSNWKRVKDAIAALNQQEALITWQQQDIKPYPHMLGVINVICRMPSPADVAATNTPPPD